MVTERKNWINPYKRGTERHRQRESEIRMLVRAVESAPAFLPEASADSGIGVMFAGMDQELRLYRQQRDELRAILAPLLEKPWELVSVDHWQGEDGFGCDMNDNYVCRFCEAESGAPREGDDGHRPDCLIFRKDELLGRN